MPERDIGSLGEMEWGLEAGRQEIIASPSSPSLSSLSSAAAGKQPGWSALTWEAKSCASCANSSDVLGVLTPIRAA